MYINNNSKYKVIDLLIINYYNYFMKVNKLWFRFTLDTLCLQKKVGNGSVLMGTECLNTRFTGSVCVKLKKI